MLFGASQDKILITRSIQFMGTKHARSNKDNLRISSYNYWQPEEKLSLIIKLFIVFTITLFLNLPQVLFINAFALSLIPSLPTPLVQKPAKSTPFSHERRRITLVQIIVPHQNQQYLLVMMLCITTASVTHCINSHVKKGFHCRDLHKKLIRSTTQENGKLAANLLWTHFSRPEAWELEWACWHLHLA